VRLYRSFLIIFLSIVVFFNSTSYSSAQQERLHPSAKNYKKKNNNKKGTSEGSYLDNRLFTVLRLGIGIPNGDTEFNVDGVPGGSGTDIVDNKLFGASIGINYRLHQYVSLESSIGLQKGSAQVVTNLITDETDEGSIFFIPTTLSVLVHPGSIKGIKPYIGAGYHYTFVASTFDRVTTSDSANGALIRAGFDMKMGKKSYFNFDIEHKFMEFDIDYTDFVGGSTTLKETANMDTTTISVGVKFKF